jgi:hypothetical protein
LAPLMKIVRSSPDTDRYGQGLALRDWALARAYDLDPRAVRPLVLAEMRAPHKSVFYPGSLRIEALATLPDQTLPEMDEAFVDQLTSNATLYDLELTAGLMSRYATKAIEPQAKGFFERAAGRWACALQSSMLAYFLRVDDAYGTEAFAKCLASRETGCWRTLFTDVGRQVWTPALGTLAVGALDDKDVVVRGDATNALMKFDPELAAKAEGSLSSP